MGHQGEREGAKHHQPAFQSFIRATALYAGIVAEKEPSLPTWIFEAQLVTFSVVRMLQSENQTVSVNSFARLISAASHAPAARPLLKEACQAPPELFIATKPESPRPNAASQYQ